MTDNYRQAERILYTHTETRRRWEVAVAELSRLTQVGDVHAQVYTDNHMSFGQVSDPPGDYVNRVLNLEGLIHRLERKVRAVESVLSDYEASDNDRDKQKEQVYYHYYVNREDMLLVSISLRMHYRTVYRRRQELVRDVMSAYERERLRGMKEGERLAT